MNKMIESKKGQISIDFLLAFVAALSFFAGMTLYLDGMNNNLNELTLEHGLDAVLIDAYSTVGVIRTYGGEAIYIIPNINLTNNSETIECILKFENNPSGVSRIEVHSNGFSKKYENIDLSRININGNPISSTPGNEYACGTTILITR